MCGKVWAVLPNPYNVYSWTREYSYLALGAEYGLALSWPNHRMARMWMMLLVRKCAPHLHKATMMTSVFHQTCE